MSTPAPELSPYDTGARCEAKPWIPYGTSVDASTPAENFCKVDFDDDCGDTDCVIYVEKKPEGTLTVHVESMIDAGQWTVSLTAGV